MRIPTLSFRRTAPSRAPPDNLSQHRQRATRQCGGLTLAGWAEASRAPALPDLPDCGTADSARQAFPAIHWIVELEIAGLAAAVHVVARRRSSLRDRVGERRTHLCNEPREAHLRHAVRRLRR